MSDITTPEEGPIAASVEEGEELDVTVIDVTDPEPIEEEDEPFIAGECTGFKKDGSKCHAMKSAGTEFCQWHQADGKPPAWVEENRSPAEYEAEVAPVLSLGNWPRYVRVLESGETIKRHKPYPFHDGGVNENAAIRMVAMVHPDCPMDSNPEIMRRDGTSIVNPRYTGEPNCQLVHKFNNQGKWDVQNCISLGHDPYFTVFRKTRVEETTDAEGYVIGTRERILRERRINIIQVSDNPRHTARTEVALALARGSVLLDQMVLEDAEGEFVFDSPCEFRQCSAPWTIDTRYGRFCTERHARLVAADFQKKMLPIAGGDPYSEDQAAQEREDVLASLNINKAG